MILPTLNEPVRDLIDIIDFFNYFFDNDSINLVVNYTNKRLDEEERTTNNELKAFIGLLLMFGVTNKNEIDTAEIWSPDSVHHLNSWNDQS